MEPVAAPVAQAAHSTSRNPNVLQRTLAKMMASDGIHLSFKCIFLFETIDNTICNICALGLGVDSTLNFCFLLPIRWR